jgi:hypothetical protein
LFAALAAAASISPASASVTVGQLAPSTPVSNCDITFDFVQIGQTSGNSYVMPATGTITSWSSNAGPGAGQLVKLKVFRKVADPAIYQAVAHGPDTLLAASALNTFPVNIAVKAGDVLGLHGAGGADYGCAFPAPGETSLRARGGDLADGAAGDFPITDQTNKRANVTAALSPSNTFTLGSTTRNKKKGTATLTATVPNPGVLALSGNGVKTAGARISVAVAAPGAVQLLIKAQGKKKRKLTDKGKVKLSPTITYTPTGGDPSTQSLKVKLKKKL